MDPLCGANACFSPPQSTGSDTGAGTEMPEVAVRAFISARPEWGRGYRQLEFVLRGVCAQPSLCMAQQIRDRQVGEGGRQQKGF